MPTIQSRQDRLALRALKEEVPAELRSYFQKPTAVVLAPMNRCG